MYQPMHAYEARRIRVIHLDQAKPHELPQPSLRFDVLRVQLGHGIDPRQRHRVRRESRDSIEQLACNRACFADREVERGKHPCWIVLAPKLLSVDRSV